MKRIILLAILSNCICNSFAQAYASFGIQADLSEVIRGQVRKAEPGQRIQTFSGETVGSRFYYPEFTEGMVISPNKDTFSSAYFFIYDKVAQQLYLINKSDLYKENPVVTQIYKDQVQKFMLKAKDQSPRWFINARYYDPTNVKDYYEILEQRDSGLTVLSKIETEYTPSNINNAGDYLRGQTKDVYKDKQTVLISFKHGVPTPVEIKKKKIAEAFPSELKPFVDYYWYSHDQEEFDGQFVARMAKEINVQYYPN